MQTCPGACGLEVGFSEARVAAEADGPLFSVGMSACRPQAMAHSQLRGDIFELKPGDGVTMKVRGLTRSSH